MTFQLLATLCPVPRRVQTGEGSLALGALQGQALTARGPEAARQLLELALTPVLEALGASLHWVEGLADLHVELEAGGHPESYLLEVGGAGLRLMAPQTSGLRHGARTLGQLLRATHLRSGTELPCLRIEDEPSFPVRGLMLDISRDRVPTQEELKARLELAAELRFNHVQLYTEHTFAYAGHERVWRHASPLTPEEVRELDNYAAERGIELAPNQNSFGHLHRWLRHPEYAHLAEAPAGIEHAFSFRREPFGLCPTDPAALEFLEGLYDQLLPCFRSDRFNAGLDETLDLGLGRSAQACAERGRGRVYLDFLLEVAERVRARGRRLHYWADIALEYPDLLSELPPDGVPIVWGYEADHPFEQQVSALAAAGLRPWVAPGTSSWQGLSGRLANARANLECAARVGAAHGCEGYLVCDWGDYGHWQSHPISLPGFVLGAARAWNPEAPEPDLEAVLSAHVLQDPTGQSARALLQLGQATEALGSPAQNGVATFFHLRYAHEPLPIERAPDLTPAGCAAFEEALGRVHAQLSGARPTGQGGPTVLAELDWATRASAWSARLASARLELPAGSHLHQVPRVKAAPLLQELNELIEQQRALWQARSRPGGLEDSLDKLARVGRLLSGLAAAGGA